MSSFTDGKAFVVSEERFLSFKRVRKRFSCSLCGVTFEVGSVARWIYANGTPGIGTGNFFVCKDCDGENEVILQKAKESLAMATKMAKQWDIYGPDWQDDIQRELRNESLDH